MKRYYLLGLLTLCLFAGLVIACSDDSGTEEGPCGSRTACMQPLDCGGGGVSEFVCASDGCCYNFADSCSLDEYKDLTRCQEEDGDVEEVVETCPEGNSHCCLTTSDNADADCNPSGIGSWTCDIDNDLCVCPEQYELDDSGISRCCDNSHCPAPNPDIEGDAGFVCYPAEHQCVPECTVDTSKEHECCTRSDGYSPQCAENDNGLTECKDGFCVEPGETAPPGWECTSDNDCNSPENCLQQFYQCTWNDATARDKKLCQLKTPCTAGTQVCCNEQVGACTPGCYELGDYLEDTGILTCNDDGKNYMLSRCSSDYDTWPGDAPEATDLYDCMNLGTSMACMYAGRCTVLTEVDPSSDPAKNLSDECGWDNPYKVCLEKVTDEWTGLVCSLRTVGEGVLCMDIEGYMAADCDVGLVCQYEADQEGNPTSPGYCVEAPEEEGGRR